MNSTQLMEKVAEVAPEKYDFIVKTAAEVRESPFRDEIVGELDGIFKKASTGFGDTLKNFGGAVGAGIATTVAGGIGLALAGDAYDAIRRGITKSRNYKRMLAANPDLKDKPATQVQTIFSTLHRFNPEFSGDPAVAGSFVRNHVDLAAEGAGAVGIDTAKALVDSHKNLTEVRSKQFPQMAKLDGPRDTYKLDKPGDYKIHKV